MAGPAGGRERAAGEAAVSDIVGSVLLVGITVLAASGLGLLVLSFDGPPDRMHLDIEMRTTSGADGVWDSGDERMQLVHLGGEALPRSGTRLAYSADGSNHTYSNTLLADAFADGQLTIGEVWTSPAAAADYLDVAQDEAVTATLVTEQQVGQLLASGTVSGGGIVLTPSTGCSPDATAPVVTLSHSPSDLDTGHGSASVAVTVTAADACNDVDDSVDPHLWYRITPGPAPGPTAFTDLGEMTFQAGSSWQWTASIPAPAGGWALAWGQSLEFYVAGLQDTAPTPNVLFQSTTFSDEVDLVGTSYFAQYPTEVAGKFQAAAPFSDVQADDSDFAGLVEACTGGAPVSNVQSLCGTTAGGVSVTSATLALTSDDQRSSHTGSGTSVHATGFDLPQSALGTVSSFTIVHEGQRGGGGSVSPTVQLEYQFDSSCAGATWTTVGSTFTLSLTTDVTTEQAVGGGPFTLAQVESLCVRARVTNAATRALLTDALTVKVTYPSAATTYDLNVEFGWTNLTVGGSSLGLLEIDYIAASGESYTVEKYGGSSWTACSGTMASTTEGRFQCSLTNAELLSGDPLIRILGAADAGAASTLQLDMVRLAVFG